MAKIYNLRKIKENNIRLVLREILRNQPISRSEIAQKTNVSNATISYIVNSLLSENLVVETTKGRSTGGRKPVFLEMNPKSKYMIGVDLSDYTVMYAVVDANLEVAYCDRLVMNPDEDIEENLLHLAKTLKRVFEKSEYKDKIVGIGLGVSGVYDDKEDRVLTSEIRGIETVRIKNLFSSILDLPIWIENDANCTALAEIMKLKGVKNLFLFYMSKGIGGGIILDDRLYRGETGFAGEISKNAMIVRNGAIRTIGDFFSETYFKRRIGKDMMLGDVMEEYNRRGDKEVKILMDDLQRCMTAIFLNVVSLLDIRTIIVGGKYGTFDRAFLRKIEMDIQRMFFGESVRVLPSALGSDGIILGSAQMVLENYIKVI